MSKSNHFIGQPILKQLLFHLDKVEILKISRENGGEKYIKRFDAWQHLCIMLYAVISRFDSLREIVSLTMLETRKLGHLGIDHLPRRSTLSDANARRPEKVFEQIYRSLYERHRDKPPELVNGYRAEYALRYFYGESANAIKIQIWVVLIANLLLSLLQHSTTRLWSFSGLATVVRICIFSFYVFLFLISLPDAEAGEDGA